MKLIGATQVYNEEGLVKYVMPYVERMGYDKFIVYDDGCTDNTIELLKKYPFIEIRPKNEVEGGDFDARKIKCMSDTIKECANIIAETGEEVWMTFTDFDEVIFCQRERSDTVKGTLEFVDKEGYNYYDGRMLHLTWDGKSYNNDLAHTWDGVRGTWWLREGRKVTLLKVSALRNYFVTSGNHNLGVVPADGIEMKNLDATGEFNGFHFKYFVDTLKHRDKDKQLVSDADYAVKTVRDCSFPLSDYFLMKGFFVQKTPPNSRDLGEGLVLFDKL